MKIRSTETEDTRIEPVPALTFVLISTDAHPLISRPKRERGFGQMQSGFGQMHL